MHNRYKYTHTHVYIYIYIYIYICTHIHTHTVEVWVPEIDASIINMNAYSRPMAFRSKWIPREESSDESSPETDRSGSIFSPFYSFMEQVFLLNNIYLYIYVCVYVCMGSHQMKAHQRLTEVAPYSRLCTHLLSTCMHIYIHTYRPRHHATSRQTPCQPYVMSQMTIYPYIHAYIHTYIQAKTPRNKQADAMPAVRDQQNDDISIHTYMHTYIQAKTPRNKQTDAMPAVRDEPNDDISKGWSELFSNALPLNSIFGGKPSIVVDDKKAFQAVGNGAGVKAGDVPEYDSDGFD
jgi:hypothetical protein